MSLEAGTRLGPYSIVAQLGAGGMGEVYEARDERLGRHVAIKILAPHLGNRPDALERFEQEARLVASLSHPNVIAVFDVGHENGLNYVVTELLEGESLRSALERGAMTPREAIHLAIAACHGLAAAHQRGIVHRDIKPENIFITADGRLKILDFGLARLDDLRSLGLPAGDETFVKTPAGQILGTVGYMSPEQVRAEPADQTSDIFSLGCVLYEMLTGRRPFARPSAAETMHAILHESPPPLSGSADIHKVIHKCLDKSPNNRYQSTLDLAEALQPLVSETQTTKIHAPAREKQEASIAVLPFTAESSDEETDHLASGLTESLINRLSSAGGIRVVARSSVMRFKGADVDPQAAGRQLRVAYVLTGRAVRRAKGSHVQAELVQVSDASQVWGEQYREKDEDTVADDIAENVRAKIVPKSRAKTASRKSAKKVSAISSDTLHQVSAARSHALRATNEGLRKAIALLEEMLARTPDIGLAHAALAELYVDLALQGSHPAVELRAKAMTAVERASELAPDLAETRLAIGVVAGYFEWQWERARTNIRDAIELAPDDPVHHQKYGSILVATGRLSEGLTETDRASEQGQASAALASDAALTYWLARRFDQAIEAAHRAIVLSGESTHSRSILGLTLAQKGLFDEAIDELQGDDPEMSAALGYVYGLAKKKAGATKIADRLKRPARPRYLAPYLIARIDAALGETSSALELLQRAFDEKSPLLAWLRTDPAFDSLRFHPTVALMTERVGLL